MYTPKAFLEEQIYNFLDDLVEDLDPESLQVGLWSGNVQLTDVTLKGGVHSRDFGKGMHVTLEYGHIEDAKLQVPWTSLQTGSIKGSLENVSLVFRAHLAEEEDEAFRESLLHKMKMVWLKCYVCFSLCVYILWNGVYICFALFHLFQCHPIILIFRLHNFHIIFFH